MKGIPGLCAALTLLGAVVCLAVSVRGDVDAAGGPTPRYRVAELLLKFELTQAPLSINSAGDVAGTCLNGRGQDVAFYYHNGVVINVDANTEQSGATRVIALNDRGQILLKRCKSGEDVESIYGEPLLWDGGRFKDIGPAPASTFHQASPFRDGSSVGRESSVQATVASAINKEGQVVGYFVGSVAGFDMRPPTRPFLWQDGKFTDLRDREGMGKSRQDRVFPILPVGINDRSEIVGYGNDGGGQTGPRRTVAVVWGRETSRTVEVRSKLDRSAGSLEATPVRMKFSDPIRPYAINDQGFWVGIHGDSGSPHDCFWSGETGAVQDLEDGSIEVAGTNTPQNQSWAYSINNKSQIVGAVVRATGSRSGQIACLWQDGKLRDLNSLVEDNAGIRLETAYGINDAGQIVVMGYQKEGDSKAHAYILTPLKP